MAEKRRVCGDCCYCKKFEQGYGRNKEKFAVCVYEAFKADTFTELKEAEIPLTVGFAYACSDFKEQ